jgi:hypothetical protein
VVYWSDSWLQIRRTGYDFRRYHIFWKVVERSPLSLVSTTEELGRYSSLADLRPLSTEMNAETLLNTAFRTLKLSPLMSKECSFTSGYWTTLPVTFWRLAKPGFSLSFHLNCEVVVVAVMPISSPLQIFPMAVALQFLRRNIFIRTSQRNQFLESGAITRQIFLHGKKYI